MNKEEIKYIKTENGYKVSMPLITNEELDYIDFNFHSIVDEYFKGFNEKKEKTIEQRLIYDLEQENKELKDNWNELKKWLEEEKDRLAREYSSIYEDDLGKTRFVNEDIYNEVKNISNKMQELESSDSNE